MSQNFGLYTSEKYNASKERVISYERYHHEELFLQGDSEYEQGNYSDCIMTFEASLDEYYREYSKCQALCEFQHEKHQVSYSMALFQHYLAIVQCRLDCHDKLSFVNGIKREKFLEDHYHYLQFCYFESKLPSSFFVQIPFLRVCCQLTSCQILFKCLSDILCYFEQYMQKALLLILVVSELQSILFCFL